MTMEKDSTEPTSRPDETGRYHTFRELLQQTLNNRCSRNPSYSLRSFAQSVGVNHAILSLLLRNKRKMTERHILTIGSKLGLKQQDLSYYINQLKLEQPQATETRYARFSALTPEQSAILTHWSYDAILELKRTENFRLEVPWIAKRLGISPEVVSTALDQLQKHKLLDAGDTSSISFGETTSEIQKKYQNSVLEKSIQQLEQVDLEYRSHTSLTLSIPLVNIGLAKQMIREFRSKMQRTLQGAQNLNDEVYQLQISFFPLTELETLDESSEV